MEKIIKEFNKKKVFHVIESSNQVKVMKEPSQLDEKGKKMLQDYYGFTDFTVPGSKVDEVVKKAEELSVKEKVKFPQEGTHQGDPAKMKESRTVKTSQEKRRTDVVETK